MKYSLNPPNELTQSCFGFNAIKPALENDRDPYL